MEAATPCARGCNPTCCVAGESCTELQQYETASGYFASARAVAAALVEVRVRVKVRGKV